MKLNKPFPYKTVIDREISNLSDIDIDVKEVDITEIISKQNDIIKGQNDIISLLEQVVENTTPEPEPEPETEE